MKPMNQMKKYGAVVLSTVVAAPAMAATAIDASGLVTKIESNEAVIVAIGMAVLAVCAVIFTIKIVRRAF